MKEIDNNDIISAELIGLFTHQNKAELIFCLKTHHACTVLGVLRYYDNNMRQQQEPTQIWEACILALW